MVVIQNNRCSAVKTCWVLVHLIICQSRWQFKRKQLGFGSLIHSSMSQASSPTTTTHLIYLTHSNNHIVVYTCQKHVQRYTYVWDIPTSIIAVAVSNSTQSRFDTIPVQYSDCKVVRIGLENFFFRLIQWIIVKP